MHEVIEFMGVLGNLVESQQVTGLGVINQLVAALRNRTLDTKICTIDIFTLLSPALQVCLLYTSPSPRD